MLGAFIKAIVTAAILIAAPLCVLLMVCFWGVSYKLFVMLMALFLPFIIIGLIYGYLAGCETE